MGLLCVLGKKQWSTRRLLLPADNNVLSRGLFYYKDATTALYVEKLARRNARQ